jgi:hypothetical protein
MPPNAKPQYWIICTCRDEKDALAGVGTIDIFGEKHCYTIDIVNELIKAGAKFFTKPPKGPEAEVTEFMGGIRSNPDQSILDNLLSLPLCGELPGWEECCGEIAQQDLIAGMAGIK